MRFHRYKHLISCFLAIILFTSGMCIQLTDTDSYFASQVQSETQSPQYQSADSLTFIFSDYCTPELLQANRSHHLRNDAKRNFLRSSKNRTTSTIALTTNDNLFYFEERYLTDVPTTTFNRIVIINYIHLQDGEK